jgi:hypothetical protein
VMRSGGDEPRSNVRLEARSNCDRHAVSAYGRIVTRREPNRIHQGISKPPGAARYPPT